jgi:hypothetical protein
MQNTRGSEKLEIYMRKIEMETGRQIRIDELPSSELYRMKSAFVHDPTFIIVILALGSRLTDPEIEQSVAHEVTHGLLVYKMKYCLGFYRRTPDDKEKKLVTLIFTMVSDIVVNRILQREGFSPYSPKYPEMVIKETTAMQNGLTLYEKNLDDTTYRDKLLVFRYILAWGYLKFMDLNEEMQQILTQFVNEFQLKYTEQFKSALEIQGIILINDIFKPDGFRTVIERLLKLWRLEELVELRTF